MNYSQLTFDEHRGQTCFFYRGKPYTIGESPTPAQDCRLAALIVGLIAHLGAGPDQLSEHLLVLDNLRVVLRIGR